MPGFIEVTVKDNTRLNQLVNQFPGSAARAINRTADRARVIISSRIRDVFKVKAEALKEVKGKPTIYVSNRATGSRQAAAVKIGGRHIPWGKFPVQWARTMAGARIAYKSGLSNLIRHSFVPLLPSGHKGVFIRKGEKRTARSGSVHGKTGYLRQPIMEIAGPSPAQMFQDPQVDKDVRQDVISALGKELDRAMGEIKRGYGA